MNRRKIRAVLFALMAALFYAVNIPLSKLLLDKIEPIFLASFLYFGAGLGIGAVYLTGKYSIAAGGDRLSSEDLPFTLGMIALDIAAPILLMLGLKSSESSSASLLNNFEIVATSLIALMIFKEIISKKTWLAVFLITIASALLSFKDISVLKFSTGSVLILAATVCWGFENNFTRKISSKNTFQIVMIKGIFSGLGSFFVAVILRNPFPRLLYIFLALLLGLVAYGLSIFLYVKAQKELGAAKTSAFYAIAPFAGAVFSFVFLNETLTANFSFALLIMIAGSVLIVYDTMYNQIT